MQGLKSAPARAGYSDAKAFCKAIGLDYITFSKAANGHINLIPPQFNTVRIAANMAPEEVATAEDVDYGIPIGNVSRKRGKPDKRKNPCRLQTRADIETDFAFRALCYEEGITVSDKLLELVKEAISVACTEQMREVG